MNHDKTKTIQVCIVLIAITIILQYLFVMCDIHYHKVINNLDHVKVNCFHKCDNFKLSV